MLYLILLIVLFIIIKLLVSLADWFFYTDEAKKRKTITKIAEFIGGK